MKRILLLLSLFLVVVSCRKLVGYDAETYFFRSYINRYMDGDFSVGGGLTNPYDDETYPCYLIYNFRDGKSAFYCASPELSDRDDPERFLEIAERNGDRTYNRKEVVPTPDAIRYAYAKNFRSVRVVCLNAAWDEAHPAGSDLGDVAWIWHHSYAPYVRSGYTSPQPLPFVEVEKRLSELAEDDLSMLKAEVGYIYFEALPPMPGAYEMQVTFTTTEGEERTATHTFDFE